MESQFTKIIELVRSIAPESAGNLNAPAGPDLVAKLLKAVPDIPTELVSLLKIHNGEEAISWISIFPNGMQLMDVDSIIESVKFQRSTPDEFMEDIEGLVADNIMDRPKGPIKPVFQYSKRIPFAQLNGDVIWYLDMDPAPGGNTAQVVEEDVEGMKLRTIASSLSDICQMYLKDIERGIFTADEQGQIANESEQWPD